MPDTFACFCLSEIFPFRISHVALLIVQVIACFNGMLTDAALAEEETELSPLTLAVGRSIVATVIVSFVRYLYLDAKREEAEMIREEQEEELERIKQARVLEIVKKSFSSYNNNSNDDDPITGTKKTSQDAQLLEITAQRSSFSASSPTSSRKRTKTMTTTTTISDDEDQVDDDQKQNKKNNNKKKKTTTTQASATVDYNVLQSSPVRVRIVSRRRHQKEEHDDTAAAAHHLQQHQQHRHHDVPPAASLSAQNSNTKEHNDDDNGVIFEQLTHSASSSSPHYLTGEMKKKKTSFSDYGNDPKSSSLHFASRPAAIHATGGSAAIAQQQEQRGGGGGGGGPPLAMWSPLSAVASADSFVVASRLKEAEQFGGATAEGRSDDRKKKQEGGIGRNDNDDDDDGDVVRVAQEMISSSSKNKNKKNLPEDGQESSSSSTTSDSDEVDVATITIVAPPRPTTATTTSTMINTNKTPVSSSQQDPLQQTHQNIILLNPKTPAPRLDMMDIIRVSLLGFVVISLDLLCYYYGLWLTDAATFSTMISLIPTITFIVGLAIGLDTFSFSKVVAIFFVLAGNMLMAHIDRLFKGEENEVFSGPLPGGDASTSVAMYGFGIAVSFFAAVCFALYLVLQRPLVGRLSFADFLFYLYWSGTAGLLIMTLIPRNRIVSDQILGGKLSFRSWATILYGGGVHATLDYFLLAYATNKAGSSLVAAIFNGLQPLVQVMMSPRRRQRMDAWQIVGAAAVLWGVYCAILATIHHHRQDSAEVAAAAAAAAAATASAPSSSSPTITTPQQPVEEETSEEEEKRQQQ